MDVVSLIATEESIKQGQVAVVLALLSDGGTVPFIARYRKERTGGLDEVQIRSIAERFEYLGELQQRRETSLAPQQVREALGHLDDVAARRAPDATLPVASLGEQEADRAVQLAVHVRCEHR